MGLFDFLKKSEFAEIERLQLEIERIKSSSGSEIESLEQQLSRYGAIVDIEKEVSQKKIELNQIVESKTLEINKQKSDLNDLNQNYQGALEIYKKLRKEISLFETKLDLIEFGVYESVYDFEKSDDYRNEQDRIIEQQKAMIQLDTAAICSTNWTVEGSESKGRAVVKVYKKLMLRAFNGECDVMIAKVKWNNINQMKERINKIFNAINKLGEGFRVYINVDYLTLKERELILEYEFQAKRQKEKEEMRAIQDELREEEKARRDFERAQREAEREEARYQKILEKVRKEYEQSHGGESEKLKSQIALLEQELKEVQEKKERALSMAQQTKRGHVYIISNVGAFGENVFKIGMTRRLEPVDRVRELGDASVPFHFDVHAMIYSDEARTLESELHKAFADKKINMLNNRKEFFRVSLGEVEETVKGLGFEAEFSRLPEAKEYHETLAILDKRSNQENTKTLDEIINEEFPNSLLIETNDD